MKLTSFETRSGETILCRLHPNRRWYAVVWKIAGWLLVITLLTFVLFSFFYKSLVGLLLGFLPPEVAMISTQVLCLGVVPLLIIAWAVEDVIRLFTGDFILTDQRLWVSGSPYAWNQGEIPLEDITSMSYRRDAIFVRQRSTSRLHVLMVSGGQLFVDAYDNIKPR